jgi:hypothetical protein
MIEKENQFQKRMSFLFDEMIKFDQHIVSEMKRIFERFITEQSLHFNMTQVGLSLRIVSILSK